MRRLNGGRRVMFGIFDIYPIVLQVITATRDITGGSLGYTPERYDGGSSIYAVQFLGKETWYLIACRRLYCRYQMIHLARHGERHWGVVADGVRRGRWRALCHWGRRWVLDHDPIDRDIPHLVRHRRSRPGQLVYGTLLVLFIIFLPQGLLGSVLAMLTRREVVRHD